MAAYVGYIPFATISSEFFQILFLNESLCEMDIITMAAPLWRLLIKGCIWHLSKFLTYLVMKMA